MPSSVMSHSFAEVPRANIPRSQFDRSHGLKTTFDADYLVPILLDDVLPGDTYNVRFKFFARLATPLYPIMDNMFLETFFFFVPYRLVWDNWEKMHGAQDDPSDSIDFSVPQFAGTVTPATGSVYDYFGLPNGKVLAANTISTLPFRGYYLIRDEWFRNQNLDDSLGISTADAGEIQSAFELQKRRKRHDYFTAALPQPQKGAAVSLSLGTVADIYADPVGAGTLSLLVDDGIGGT